MSPRNLSHEFAITKKMINFAEKVRACILLRNNTMPYILYILTLFIHFTRGYIFDLVKFFLTDIVSQISAQDHFRRTFRNTP